MTKYFVIIVSLFTSSTLYAQTPVPKDIQALLQKNTCLACHSVDKKIVGPSYKDIRKKNYKADQIVNLIYNPQPKNWPGYPPMAPMKQVPKTEALKIANWIATLK